MSPTRKGRLQLRPQKGLQNRIWNGPHDPGPSGTALLLEGSRAMSTESQPFLRVSLASRVWEISQVQCMKGRLALGDPS